MRRFWPVLPLGIAALLLAGRAEGTEGYRTQGDCDGFPRISLKVPPPLCVGLVAQHLGFARGVAAIGRDIFVVDMGGWGSHHGRLLRLADGGRATPQVLLRDLFQPNGLVPGPGRTLLLGITGSVVQLDPFAPDPAQTVRVIVPGLPTAGRHPVPALAMAPNGALAINVGSATDHCETEERKAPDPHAACPETRERPARGSILELPPGLAPTPAHEVPVLARGLRNSMALAYLPDGRLVAAVNARDYINRADPALSDEDLPHDTFVVVEPGADYGWPYCYDNGIASPEYPGFDCHDRKLPTMLLPAHAAPLGMLLYRGARLPGLDHHLVVPYHGYRRTGHRIVSIGLDANGEPSGAPVEFVGDWGFATGNHPQGAPVAVFEMDDGSVLITEDKNGTLLRLSVQATQP